MEREIAKYLDGERTPMSGAGSTKGDVRVLFKNRPGHYMIECKLSALLSERNFPVIRIPLQWLTKIDQEAKAMRSLFGVLIVQYKSVSDKFVMIRIEDLHKLYTPDHAMEVLDFAAKTAASISMKLQQFRAVTAQHGIGIIKTRIGDYYAIELKRFKEIMDGV